ncbi:hypothetical protein ACFOGG_15580 [Brenneria rubrifaciens]
MVKEAAKAAFFTSAICANGRGKKAGKSELPACAETNRRCQNA